MYDNAYSNNGHFYATAGIFNMDPNNRPRSTTLGTLDQPVKRNHSHRSNGGYLASIPQSPAAGHIEPNSRFGYNNARSYSERDLTRSRESSRGPRHSISSHSSRTGTPDFDKSGSTPQMPTRSLWIGNLDVNATSEALFQVFAPYGAIESIRLLPEKVNCASNTSVEADDADMRVCQLYGSLRCCPRPRRCAQPSWRTGSSLVRDCSCTYRIWQDRFCPERTNDEHCRARAARACLYQWLRRWGGSASSRRACSSGIARGQYRPEYLPDSGFVDRKYPRYHLIRHASPSLFAFWSSRISSSLDGQGQSADRMLVVFTLTGPVLRVHQF